MGLTSITKAFDPVVPVTVSDLTALLTAGELVEGTTYSITDSQDALGGTVNLLALSNTVLETDGYWNFTAHLGAQGRFMINSGNAGSINQITVTTPSGPVNLLTAPVLYNTTRNQTATDVVTAINANTLVSGFRAWVVTSTTSGDNFDQPFVHFESLVGQTGFTYTVSINTTTLTVNNVLNGSLGFTSEDIQLLCKYDIPNDMIISARDNRYDITITTTIARISNLGYNPVTTFRWNDRRLRNWQINDSGVRDIHFRNSAATVFREVILDNCIFQRFTTNVGNQSRIDLRSGSTFSNINTTTGTNLGNVKGLYNIQNIDCSTLNLTSTDGGITVTNSTFGNTTSRGSCSFATTAGTITFIGNTYRATVLLQVSNNVMNIGSVIRLQNNTWASASSRCVISQNNLTANLIIDNNVDLGILIVTNNVFQSSAQINTCIFTGSSQQLIQSNTMSGPATGILSFGDLCFNLNASTFPFDVYIANNQGAVYIQPNSTCTTIFNITNTTVDNTYVFPVMSDCDIQYSTFISEDPSTLYINNCSPMAPVNMRVINSTVDTLAICFCDTINIENSTVRHVTINNGANPFSTFTVKDSDVEYTDFETGWPIPTITINYTSLIRGEYTTTYLHDFALAPLNAGTPIYITDQFGGYIKEKASVSAWNTWVESVPGVTFEVGDNLGSSYITRPVAVVGSSASFEQDTTLAPGSIIVGSSVLEMKCFGGNITSGTAVIVVSGKYMYVKV